ncbi:unnamed protein product [Fraxinus pennsylvanica]|uniref:Uncharacterized protein n=1 Tax=Fraxinus pennsylvanica TaxID=56036 RepID=A0AAD1Z7V3_9LAMI|nr:unnamed protein product [Fraxinus pennsylvanica]
MEMDYLNLVKSDIYFDLECARSKDKQLDEEYEFVKQLEKETDMEQSYKDLLLCLLTKEVRFVPNKRKNEKDDIYENDEDWSHEENDPEYELFLRNLVKHEKSYVFNHKKNGSCLFIRYEEDSDSDDDSDPESHRKLTGRKPQRKLKNTVKGERIEAMRCSSDSMMPDSDYLSFIKNTKIEGNYLVLPHEGGMIEYEKDAVKGERIEAMRCSSDSMMPDSDHLSFIKNTKIEGNYLVLPHEGGMIEYEKDAVKGERIEAMRCSSDSMMPDSDHLSFIKNTKIEGNYLVLPHEGGMIVYEKDAVKGERIEAMRCSSDSMMPDSDHLSFIKNTKIEGNYLVLPHEGGMIVYEKDAVKGERIEAMRCSSDSMMPDSDHLSFIKNTKIEGNYLVLPHEGGMIVYEKDAVKGERIEAMRCSSDSMMPDSDHLSFIKNTKIEGNYLVLPHEGGMIVYEKDGVVISPQKGDNDDSADLKILDIAREDESENFMFIEEDSSKMHRDFRRELMCIFRKEYDREEYKQLWQDVEVRKAALRHRELRNGRENAYSTDKAGKSYLDLYPDLKEALLRCQDDKPRCLNLLRGFFFWLQCLTREGAFKPWKDPQCLAVEPICCPPSWS